MAMTLLVAWQPADAHSPRVYRQRRSARDRTHNPTTIELGRGALLAPAGQALALREALDEAGARYDAIEVWRSA